MPVNPINLEIVNRSGVPVPRGFLQWWVRELDRQAARFVPAQRYRGRDLTLVFLDTRAAKVLNRQWRGKDYATDVLSFDGDDYSNLGELVICPQVIRKQAREHGLLQREELGYMVIHGFLHLLGFEHENAPRKAKQMYEIQDHLFEVLCRRYETAKSK